MSTRTFARVGEGGYVLNFDTDLNEASISGAEINLTAPDGSITTLACDQVTSASGQYGATISTSTFTVPGRWKASLEVTISSGNVRKSLTPVVLLIGASDDA